MNDKLRVLLVTTWDQPCGIAEHSWYLKQAVEAADPEIEITPWTDLDPASLRSSVPVPDLVWLNYQAALHSRWTPDWIQRWRQSVNGMKIGVTYHDTGVPNSDQCQAICAAADTFVIHEPADDLPMEKGDYWRMGVPTPTPAGIHPPDGPEYWALGYRDQPRLGTIGFPFAWKCYDELAKVTAANGWAFYVIAPGATDEQMACWLRLNPCTTVRRAFVGRQAAVRLLAGCDATAFTYVCHNTGQSGAILQGIAARKPVIALSTCRQMRALYEDPLGREAIRWCSTFEEVGFALRTVSIERCDPGIVALAEQDGWARLGQRYAQLYRRLVA